MEDDPTLSSSSGLNEKASFWETNWWVVGKAGKPEAAESGPARESLCQSYWWPVYFYLRRSGYCTEDAEDLTQSFFACVLAKNYLQGAAREKGKFRSFLLVILKRFLADHQDKTNRIKRGGGQQVISLNAGDTEFRTKIEPATELTPETAFERTWARSLLDRALRLLREEMAAAGKRDDFDRLKPLISCESEETYATVAQRLSWSEANVKVTVHRLRRRLGEFLREEIAKTALSPGEVEEEIRVLFSAFS